MQSLDIPESEIEPTLFKVAVIDIGSNSVRLVVFNGMGRFSIPIFNEKVLCGLGRGLGQTGKLNPQGKELAKEAVSRFIKVIKGLGVENVYVLATAAVRDAEDGDEFVRDIEHGEHDLLGFKRNLGVHVSTITGDEEARYAAEGVLYSIYNPHGIAGDLGGGSLELVKIDGGKISGMDSLTIGHFRLMDASETDPVKAMKIAEKCLKNVEILKELKDSDFFAIGGGFRALAKMRMVEKDHPIRVVHNYREKPDSLMKLIDRVITARKVTAEEFPGLPSERIESIQYSAVVLKKIIEIGKPKSIVFSAAGVREGYLYDLLPDKEKMLDPLVASSSYLATISGCNAEYAREILKWLKIALPNANGSLKRIITAIATLSEIAWAEHPEYRSEFAFDRAIEYPLIGLEQSERVFIALSLYHRHKTKLQKYFEGIAKSILSTQEIKLATTIGLLLAVAGKISRGGVKPLSSISVKVTDKKIFVEENEIGALSFYEGDAEKKLKKLAGYLDLSVEVIRNKKLI